MYYCVFAACYDAYLQHRTIINTTSLLRYVRLIWPTNHIRKSFKVVMHIYSIAIIGTTSCQFAEQIASTISHWQLSALHLPIYVLFSVNSELCITAVHGSRAVTITGTRVNIAGIASSC